MVALLSMLVVTACSPATKRLPEQPVADGLPPWMEDGDEVRLGVARKWLDLGFTQGALSIVSQMRADG
ncbi:MAG: hypothetical protein AAGA48_20125, partial [Myxococcota bacterium]